MEVSGCCEEGDTMVIQDYGLQCNIGPGEFVPVPETGSLLYIFQPVTVFSSLANISSTDCSEQSWVQ